MGDSLTPARQRRPPRAPVVEFAQPHDERGPRRKSVFHITINSNKTAGTTPARNAMFDGLEDYIRNTFSSNEFLQEAVMFQEGTGEWSDDYIDETRVSAGLEVGAKQHRVHAHIVLTIIHRAKIRLDPGTIAASVQQELGYRPYVHIRGGGDRTFNLEEYNRKQQQAQRRLTAPTPDSTAVFRNAVV